MFLIVAMVALTMLISACSEFVPEGCRNFPADTKEICGCSTREDCLHPKCCHCRLAENPCKPETTDPTAQMEPAGDGPATQQVGLIGAVVVNNRGSFGFPCVNEPFHVVFQYHNFGNQTTASPRITPILEISESPADIVNPPFQPVRRNVPWSSGLRPGTAEEKSEMFAGIRPNNCQPSDPSCVPHGTFRATFFKLPVPTTVSHIQFEVGGSLAGPNCPRPSP
jgi:hypothetical protein